MTLLHTAAKTVRDFCSGSLSTSISFPMNNGFVAVNVVIRNCISTSSLCRAPQPGQESWRDARPRGVHQVVTPDPDEPCRNDPSGCIVFRRRASAGDEGGAIRLEVGQGEGH